MAIGTTIQYASLDELFLDPNNPRLGRHNIEQQLTQEGLLAVMRSWTLDELAESYQSNGGFWTHEALLVVEEPLYDREVERWVVVEGNRRLAALKLLRDAIEGNPISTKWSRIAEIAAPASTLFTHIPFLLADSREDVQSFLGFRHVTGIKQWGADEKAGFIAKLIDEQGMTYEEVMRKIGSQTPTVRQNYIAYRLLLQIENTIEDFDIQRAEQRFALLYGTIQTEGARHYLSIDMYAEPQLAHKPVPDDHIQNLAHFAHWLFGTEDSSPLVTDTRQVSDFGRILESAEAVEYLSRTSRPKLDVAFRIAGGDEAEIIRHVEQAADLIELALTRAHFYKNSAKLRREVNRLGIDAIQIINIFPGLLEEIVED